MGKELAVLLATYNGEKYVAELLESILSSSFIESLIIYIRDDGSTDRTVEILKEYQMKYSDNICLYFGANIGVIQGFNYLLKKALSNKHMYFMFADQDDKWSDKKIYRVIDCLKTHTHIDDRPILVHSDLFVVNEALEIITESFWNYQHINPKRDSLNRLLIQNIVTGCTIGMNKKLAELLFPMPKEIIMHDWWAALIACAFGEIIAIYEPLVYYRQHNCNTIGAQEYSLSIQKIKESFIVSKYTNQAEAFYTRFSNILDEKQLKILKAFIKLSSVNRIRGIQIIITNAFYKNGVIRNIGFILKMLVQRRL